MSADMYREMLREKWEAEQQEILDKQDTVHYANVRFDGKENFRSYACKWWAYHTIGPKFQVYDSV